MTRAVRATRKVWFATEMQTRKRGGSILHWVVKPTRHPARWPVQPEAETYYGALKASTGMVEPISAGANADALMTIRGEADAIRAGIGGAR